jgi:predicted permease
MSAADRAYRWLLTALPRDIRREFGDDMVQLFRDHRRERAGRPLLLFALWLGAVHDVVTESIVARREARRARHGARPRLQTGILEPIARGMSMNTLLHDLRHGLRLLGRQPGTSILAVATLALGIGVSTAIFSVVDAVVLRELPYADAGRLVMVWEKRPSENVLDNPVSPADFLDWRRRQEPFEAIAAATEGAATLTGQGDAIQINVGAVSAEFFDVLGVRMARGRTFERDDEIFGRHRKVILTHGFWTRVLGGNPAVLNTNLELNGTSWEVIGILPASFRFVTPGLDVWAPAVLETPTQPAPRAGHNLSVYARLQPGVSLDQARDAMDRLGRQLEAEYPDMNRGHGAWVTTLREEFVGPEETSLLVVFAAVGLVLLIACANVASLQLARSIGRRREMAVRSALGASRPRLIGQSLAEHLALALTGGLAGLLVAWLTLRGLPLVLPEQISVVDVRDIALDLRVLGFAALLTLGTSALVGFLPALSASRHDVIDTIKAGGRSHAGVRRRARGLLIVSEVALATLTLVGAGLVFRSFTSTLSQPLGFETHNRLTFGVSVPAARYATPEQRRLVLEDIENRLKTLPSVTSVGANVFLPLGGGDARTGITIESRDVAEGDPPTRMHPRVVTPAYFETVGIPIRKGRAFTPADSLAAEPVVIISDSAVRRYFKDDEPLGRRVQFVGDPTWRTIVGIAGDVKHWGLRQDVNPMLYWPQAQAQRNFLSFIVKTEGDPLAIVPAVRAQVAAVDPRLALVSVSSLDDVVADSVKSERAQTVLMAAFGGLALVLAVIGIYGITSQLVAARVPEIGVRMTLGARPRDVLRQFIGESLRQTAIGLILGLIAGALLMRLADQLLFEVKPWDPATLAAVSGVLLLASLLACVVPARRAMRVDPATSIRD